MERPWMMGMVIAMAMRRLMDGALAAGGVRRAMRPVLREGRSRVERQTEEQDAKAKRCFHHAHRHVMLRFQRCRGVR